MLPDRIDLTSASWYSLFALAPAAGLRDGRGRRHGEGRHQQDDLSQATQWANQSEAHDGADGASSARARHTRVSCAAPRGDSNNSNSCVWPFFRMAALQIALLGDQRTYAPLRLTPWSTVTQLLSAAHCWNQGWNGPGTI